MSDQAFDLRPLGSAIARHLGGGTPPRQIPSYWKGEIPWASVKDFSDDEAVISRTQECITRAGLNASASNLIPAGIPLVCTRMAVGRAALSAVPMAINQDVKALFPEAGVSPSYLLKMIKYIQPKAEVQAVGSTVKGIRVQDYLSIPVPLAPIEHQPQIARVLDTLDTAIRETEAIIAKLKSVKQGLLHDLLTRGIDANCELRPSQTEAPHLYKNSPIGWVPQEWRTPLLDEVAKRGSGHTPNKDTPSYWNGGIKWVSLADSHRLDKKYIYETDKEISALGITNSSAVLHSKGTVILSRDAGIGKSAILAEEMAVSQHFIAWACGDELNNVFLYFWLQHEKPRFESIAIGSTIKTIGLPFFKAYRVSVPSRNEQSMAVMILVGAEDCVAKYQRELEQLRQVKKGLMDDLLSGRVRVNSLLSAR